MAQFVEALRYKPEGRGFDSRWCHWNFLLTQSFRPHYGPGVDSTSNRNEYQEYFLGVKATGAYGWQSYHLHVPIVLKSGSLNLLETSGPVQACNGIALPFHSQQITLTCSSSSPGSYNQYYGHTALTFVWNTVPHLQMLLATRTQNAVSIDTSYPTSVLPLSLPHTGLSPQDWTVLYFLCKSYIAFIKCLALFHAVPEEGRTYTSYLFQVYEHSVGMMSRALRKTMLPGAMLQYKCLTY